MNTYPAEAAPRGALVRALGLSTASALVVGTVIGSGIFLVPAEMLQAVGSARLVYAAWIVGGLLSFFGALTYAELGAMKPEAGGEYVYLRDAYGPLAGFLYSWTWLLVARPAVIATVTTGMIQILEGIPVFAVLLHPFILIPFTVSYGQLAEIAVVVLVSCLNYAGVRRAGDFQVVFTLLKIAILLGVVAVCFSDTSGTWTRFTNQYRGARGGIAGFFAALVAALWAYDGWNGLAMLAGEIRDPQRNIPLALLGGVTTVGALYMLVGAAVQYVLPASAIALSKQPVTDAVALVLGGTGAGLVSVAIAISLLVTLNGTIMSGARISFATARDGYLFKRLAEVHPRYGTPAASLVAQCALAVILLLIGGSFRQFFSLAIFSQWLFYMLAGSTVFIFRRRNPEAVRPFRVWGYPAVPTLFVLASAALLYYTFTDNLESSVWGSIAILSGIPAFYYFARRKQARVSGAAW
jgi:APA family basic amino acid/polyamine antiporter